MYMQLKIHMDSIKQKNKTKKKNSKNHAKLLITSRNINYTYNNRHKVKL